jgi:hypothetical protein
MMDELLQFHIITPNSEGKAIWNCELSGGGFKKAVNLTMLKVRLEKIYFKVEDEDKDYEDIFSGDIVEKANSTVVDTKTRTNQEQGLITFICNNMYFRLGSIYRNCFVINNLY